MKLFVGNLSFETTEPELREIFEPFDPILEFVRPNDRETGRPRGFAFIPLADHEKGKAALDGMELGGRKISINEAEERPPSPRPPFEGSNNEVTKRIDDRPVDGKGKKVSINRFKSLAEKCFRGEQRFFV